MEELLPQLFPNITEILFESRSGALAAEKYLAWYKRQVDAHLKAFFKTKKREAALISPETSALVTEIERFINCGGKRVRPAFVYSGYTAAGGKAHDAIVYASASMELLHTFALIHDDIIDRSSLRREQPTTHEVFASRHRKESLSGDAAQYGLSSAILVGDLASSFADEILNSAPFPQERLRRAKYIFDQLKWEVIAGEYLDVYFGYKKGLDEDRVLKVMEYKTAKYTVERPLHIGAMLAGADTSLLDTFSKYAIPLGQAFQIQDDIVGTFGSEKEIGKPNTSDIKEGKKTLLLAKAYEWANRSQCEMLRKVVGKREATPENIEGVRRVIIRTGAYEYAVKLSYKLIEQAKEAVVVAKLDTEGKDYLLAAADYLLNRTL